MVKKHQYGYALSGGAAGLITGLFGTGGGMILIPLLQLAIKPKEDALFPTSVCIMLPVCIVAIFLETRRIVTIPWDIAWRYMLGGGIGGILAVFLAKKIPTLYLHRGLGLLILWGGLRYIW